MGGSEPDVVPRFAIHASRGPDRRAGAVRHPIMRHLKPSVLLSFVGAALLGLGAVILPVWMLSLRPYTAPLFPLVRTAVEGMSWLTFVFLLVSGLLLGLLGKGHPFLLGVTTMALLPLLAIAEMVVAPTSHNLWPLEFAMYGFISLSAVLGAYLGRYVQKRVRKHDA